MGKLKEIKGYLRSILDKLPSIKSDLVKTDERWHDWDFEELTKEISKWVDRNPVKSDPKHDQRQEQLLQAKQRDRKTCVCCNVNNHKSSQCGKVKGIQERKKAPSEKKLIMSQLHRE